MNKKFIDFIIAKTSSKFSSKYAETYVRQLLEKADSLTFSKRVMNELTCTPLELILMWNSIKIHYNTLSASQLSATAKDMYSWFESDSVDEDLIIKAVKDCVLVNKTLNDELREYMTYCKDILTPEFIFNIQSEA